MISLNQFVYGLWMKLPGGQLKKKKEKIYLMQI